MSQSKKELEDLLKTFRENEEICKVQFEQVVGELIVSQIRVEFLAKKYLSESNYASFCKNVEEFYKKVCKFEKKDVTLQSNSKEKKTKSPTPDDKK